jgi:hypothetical protein
VLKNITSYIYRVYRRNEISSLSFTGQPKKKFPFGRTLYLTLSGPEIEGVLSGIIRITCRKFYNRNVILFSKIIWLKTFFLNLMFSRLAFNMKLLLSGRAASYIWSCRTFRKIFRLPSSGLTAVFAETLDNSNIRRDLYPKTEILPMLFFFLSD